jgi:hypothetical protein
LVPRKKICSAVLSSLQPQHVLAEPERVLDLRGRDDDVEVIDQTDCHGVSIAGSGLRIYYYAKLRED